MAGFDCYVPIRRSDEEALLRACLAGLQRRVRGVGLELHYRHHHPASFYVKVDGSLAAMQATPIRVGRDLVALAEGFPMPRDMRRRQRIGRRVALAYARGVGQMTDDILELADRMGGSPGSLEFDVVDDPIVDYRLAELGALLGRYYLGDASPEQVVEEWHTVAELILGVVLGAAWDDRSFQEQVDEAVRRKLLPAPGPLTELKKRRRLARHRAQTVTAADLESLYRDVMADLHRLVKRARSIRT